MLTSMFDEFQKNQSATLKGELVTATAFLTAVKDAGAARDWGAGELVVPYFYVTSAAAFNPTTSATVEITAGDNVNLTVNAVVLSTRTVLVAALLAGTYWGMPPLLTGYSRRYLGAKVTCNGGAATTGALICGLLHKDARQQVYGDLAGSV